MPQGLPEEARVPIGVAMHLFRGGLSPAEVEIELIEDFRFHKLPLSEIAAIVRIAEQNANAAQRAEDMPHATTKDLFGENLDNTSKVTGYKLQITVHPVGHKPHVATITINSYPEATVDEVKDSFLAALHSGLLPELQDSLPSEEAEDIVVESVLQFGYNNPTLVHDRPII